MLAYTLNRLALAVAIVLVTMLILFIMILLVPGDPASIALGPRATPELIAAFHASMGLDEPFPVQFATFVGRVLHGDLRRDVFTNASVSSIVMDELPHAFALAGAGLSWAVLLGIPLGCLSAANRDSWLDRVTGVVFVSAIAVPFFVVAIYSLLIFAVWLH